ncbi:MAG: hypothetical protein JKZ00_01705 [Flavobacteriaceae bacterium]|nr:hypothetical protein [Flavobacteriaceae bacterium]
MMKKKLFLIALIIFTTDIYAQCAMCKAVVESGGKEMAEGINSGITYLMVFPYLLVAVIAYFLYRYKKKMEH